MSWSGAAAGLSCPCPGLGRHLVGPVGFPGRLHPPRRPEQIGQDVGHTQAHDDVAEGENLVEGAHRDHVGEDRQAVRGTSQVVLAHDAEVGELVGRSRPGREDGRGSHRHPSVEGDGEGVEGQAHQHQGHAHEPEVGHTEQEQNGIGGDQRGHVPAVGDAAHGGLEHQSGQEQGPTADLLVSQETGAPAAEQAQDEPDRHGDDREAHVPATLPSASVADEVLFDVSDGVARVTINRPERRNAISWGVTTGLREALARAKADPAVRVLVLTGAGDKAFCAGADLTGMAEGAGFVDLHQGRGELARLFLEMWDLGKPTIARVRGYALAGGFGLALACDLVVAADDAQFGTPEVDVGLWPYMITVPLVRSMPPKRVLELMLTGRRVSAQEAERIGFVTRVVPVDELDAAVDELAATLAAKSPAVMKLGRDAFYAVWDLPAREALGYLHTQLTLTTLTEDSREGIAAFAEKRPPRWTGR
ncbi:MAG: hypothetical protein E6G27_05005 [Actinobacteria bacterium]|nr:MAG: hypothetical protein E6G27_05005 [Actinomycetota bacterium]